MAVLCQVAQKISELTGKQASYHNIPEETAKQGMRAMACPCLIVESMLSYYVAGIRNGKMYAPTSTIRDVLGRPPRSFRRMGPRSQGNAGLS